MSSVQDCLHRFPNFGLGVLGVCLPTIRHRFGRGRARSMPEQNAVFIPERPRPGPLFRGESRNHIRDHVAADPTVPRHPAHLRPDSKLLCQFLHGIQAPAERRTGKVRRGVYAIVEVFAHIHAVRPHAHDLLLPHRHESRLVFARLPRQPQCPSHRQRFCGQSTADNIAVFIAFAKTRPVVAGIPSYRHCGATCRILNAAVGEVDLQRRREREGVIEIRERERGVVLMDDDGGVHVVGVRIGMLRFRLRAHDFAPELLGQALEEDDVVGVFVTGPFGGRGGRVQWCKHAEEERSGFWSQARHGGGGDDERAGAGE